jgi:hypothetical protein
MGMIVIIILIVTVRTEERLVQSINNCNEYQVRSKTPLLVALRYRYFILPAYTTVQILGLHYHPARDNLEVRCSAVLQVVSAAGQGSSPPKDPTSRNIASHICNRLCSCSLAHFLLSS